MDFSAKPKRAAAVCMRVLAVCTLFVAFSLAFPGMYATSEAYALDTAKATAKPNGDTGSDVYGGKETRITWEGEAGAGEQVSSIAFLFPEGTTFGLDDARVTVLSGKNRMTRDVIDADFTQNGVELEAEFPEPLPDGAYFRVEVYEVVFPSEGGEFELSGSYTLADGSVHDFTIDPISVVGITNTAALSSSLEEADWVQQWNSNKFLRLFFNPAIIVSSIPLVFNGFLLAVAIVAVSFPCAIPIGLLLAIMRMAHAREGAGRLRRAGASVLRGIASVYINVVRGTPLFLQIYIAFFGLPLAGIVVSPFILGFIVLAMNSSAYMCEIFRAGIQSIPKGQTEAARSLGMNGFQTMVFVIIPQTVRRVIPTLTSEFILLYKDTSMLAAVGVMEMVYDAKTIVANTGSITPYIVAACFYLIITLPLAKVVGVLEKKLDDSRRPTDKARGKKAKEGDIEGSGDAPVFEGSASAMMLERSNKTPIAQSGGELA